MVSERERKRGGQSGILACVCLLAQRMSPHLLLVVSWGHESPSTKIYSEPESGEQGKEKEEEEEEEEGTGEV